MVDFRNPYGAVCISDGGAPRIITVKARKDISGGYWVIGSSAVGVVSSGADSYAASDLEGYTVATQVGSEVIGIALTNIPSGTYGPVAMNGIFILPAISGTRVGSIYSGWPVAAGSAGTVFALGSNTLLPNCAAGAVGPADIKVGKALTASDVDGQYLLVSVNI